MDEMNNYQEGNTKGDDEFRYPLVIQNPGTGKDVAADGVLRNILECVN